MIQLAALPVEDALDESVVEAHNSFCCIGALGTGRETAGGGLKGTFQSMYIMHTDEQT